MDHSDLEPFPRPLNTFGEVEVVRSVAVDHGQRFAESAQAVQHRLLLPVAGVPDLVHVRESARDQVEQVIDLVPSLRVADDSKSKH